jgi:Tetratricopeptide Repeats-Sensor
MPSVYDSRLTDPESRPPPHWLAMVRQEERRGELLSAYDIANRGLEEHPENVDLAYRAVLALARAGSTSEAERRFANLHLTDVDTGDVAALRARILKDRALGASGEERRRLAEAAALAYQRIADQSGDYFPAINAATLRLVAGDTATAADLASNALSLVDASGDTTYYAAATRAEAQLLLGDPGSARAELVIAAGLHDGDFGAVSTTRRQLRMICAMTSLEEDILSALAGPTVAHYCGHMISRENGINGLRTFDEDEVRSEMAAAIARDPVGFAYGSLAGGSDILWAEALLDSGAELHVVLPFALEDFLETSVRPSGEAWVRRFHECLEGSVSMTFATEGRFLGDEILYGYCARLAMGLALLRARFLDARVLQLALWDGEPPAGEVGTAKDVATWRSTGHDSTTITPRIIGPPHDRAGGGTASRTRDDVRVVRAILTGDMCGFSKLSDEQLPAFSRAVMGSLSDVLARYDKDIEYRNTWGDAILAVVSDVSLAAHCALDLQDAMTTVDFRGFGLPKHLAFRLSGHIGPVFVTTDPVLHTPSFMGTHISRAARIEPVTPPGAVYVTEPFAASLELAGCTDLRCDYVGHMPAAKDYGRLRMYRLLRRGVANAAELAAP